MDRQEESIPNPRTCGTKPAPPATYSDESNKHKHTAKQYLPTGYKWVRDTAWRRGIKPTVQSSGFWTATATIVIAISTIVYTHYARKQWSEMHNAGAQTDRLICAAQKIESDMETANAQNLHALKKTLAQSQSATEASNRQSQKVLNANIAASRLDQRAWLSVEQMATDEEIAENALLKVHIVIRNTGKTPAQNVVFSWTIHFKLANGTETQVAGNGGAGIVLGPGAQYVEHLRGNEKITEADIANINDPAASFYITIKITYLDVLDKTKLRETDSCGMYSIPDKPLFATCKTGGYNMN